MIKGYSHKPMGTVALGTHLGNFSKEDSLKYVEAIKYAVRNGIYSIDGAINYRGMCSERDEGVALAELMNSALLPEKRYLYHLRQDYYMEIFQQSFHQ